MDAVVPQKTSLLPVVPRACTPSMMEARPTTTVNHFITLDCSPVKKGEGSRRERPSASAAVRRPLSGGLSLRGMSSGGTGIERVVYDCPSMGAAVVSKMADNHMVLDCHLGTQQLDP